MPESIDPTMILMDLAMPRIDGWQASRILKADPQTQHIPIVAFSAHALAAEQRRARDVGCDGYLAKPAEPQRVVEEIREHLARAGSRHSAGPKA